MSWLGSVGESVEENAGPDAIFIGQKTTFYITCHGDPDCRVDLAREDGADWLYQVCSVH